MDARIGIIMVNLPEKVSLHVILGAFAQKLIFQDGVRSYLLFHGFANKTRDFCEGHAGYIFYKRSIEGKSIIKTCQPENGYGIDILNSTIILATQRLTNLFSLMT